MKSTDLIAAVGGIERAREIVGGAPYSAFGYDYVGAEYICGGDMQDGYSINDCEGCICLDDLRKSIVEHDCAVAKPEFKVGDLVVFNESHYFAGVYEIEGWSARGILDGEVFISGGRRVHESVLRHATPAEIKAGHRLNPSNTGELETLEMIDISPNTVVINESN